MSRRSKFAGILALGLLACTASLAFAAKTSPRNGDFEAGTLAGWHTQNNSGTAWTAYKGTKVAGRHAYKGRKGNGLPTSFYKPPQGKFAAVASGTGSARFLYRNLHLKAGKKITLSMKVFYKNYADKFISPNTFGQGVPNQQYRIDLIKKGADLDSLNGSDVLKNIFRTKKGDKLKRKPFDVTANLSSLAGQTITLRLGEVDDQYFFYPGVDAVKLTQTRKH